MSNYLKTTIIERQVGQEMMMKARAELNAALDRPSNDVSISDMERRERHRIIMAAYAAVDKAHDYIRGVRTVAYHG